jgi:hypothetical protein
MVGDFLQKMQMARAEFERGDKIVDILFSDNPGIIPRRSTPVVTRPAVTQPVVTRPVVTRPAVVPVNVTRPVVIPVNVTRPVVLPVNVTRPAPISKVDRVAELKKAEEAKRIAAAARAKQAAEEAKRIAAARVPTPPTDPFSTLARGFARVTGAKTQPPPGTKWLY